MKTRLIITLTALPALALISPSFARGAGVGVEINVPSVQVNVPGVQVNAPGVGIQIGARSDFYTPLAPYGTWVNFSTYGRCFHPTGLSAAWRPYSVGSWESTDAGWYWNSDEPFAWACYHYGSWYYDTSVGWVWIPGTDWAPAWVDWRQSDGYIGWAPCGPNQSVLGPSFFAFCDIHHFGDRFDGRGLIFNNRDIINRTHLMKGFSRQTGEFDGRRQTFFANRGPAVDVIQRATGRTFTARPVADVQRERDTRRPENMRGNQARPEDRNARPEDRNARPEDRNVRPEDQNRQTPPPTGADQQRRYEQQQQQQRQQQENRNLRPEDQNRQATPPTGTEQQRRYEQQPQTRPQEQARPQAQPRETTPREQQPQARPEDKPNTPSPTGREQERTYQQPNAQERGHETAAPEKRDAAPVTSSEKSLPATGRENGHEAPAAAKPEQAPQHAPADNSQGQDKNKDKQQP